MNNSSCWGELVVSLLRDQTHHFLLLDQEKSLKILHSCFAVFVKRSRSVRFSVTESVFTFWMCDRRHVLQPLLFYSHILIDLSLSASVSLIMINVETPLDSWFLTFGSFWESNMLSRDLWWAQTQTSHEHTRVSSEETSLILSVCLR